MKLAFGVCLWLAVQPAVERAVDCNLTEPDPFAVTTLDSLLAREQSRPTARRVGDWAWRLAGVGRLGYRFGLADDGYVSEGRLAPGTTYDCISLVYRITELALARDARDALALALSRRFAGAPPESVVTADGRVDYDRPEHLDYSVDMIRSGLWGTDVTAQLTGARADSVGSSRYAAGSIVTVPAGGLRPSELCHGDVVWFVLSAEHPSAAALRRQYGLMIGHAGIVVVNDGEVWLVHAASRPLPAWYDAPGVVAVPLTAYLDRVERYDALMVTRFSAR